MMNGNEDSYIFPTVEESGWFCEKHDFFFTSTFHSKLGWGNKDSQLSTILEKGNYLIVFLQH